MVQNKKSNLKKIPALLFHIVVLAFIGMGCQSTEEEPVDDRPMGNQPGVEEIFAQMDINKDGKLTMEEIQGPLKADFAKVDADGDGFITKEELSKAPKPDGQRPPPDSNRQRKEPPKGN